MSQNASAAELVSAGQVTETRLKAPKPERQHRPATISLADESSLTWYFGRGGSLFERSTFGAMIDALDADGKGSRECPACRGAGILEVGGIGCYATRDEQLRERKNAERDKRPEQAATPHERPVDRGGWCPDCRGTGSVSYQRKDERSVCHVCEGRRRGPGYSLLVFSGGQRVKRSFAGDPCGECLATGKRPQNVVEKDNGPEENGYSAGEGALERFALVSRRMGRVEAVSKLLATVLRAFYGDTGARWGASEHGHLFALYSLTPSGKKLARIGLEKNAPDMTEQERIGVQASLQKQQPNANRRALLTAAANQATELYARAAQAWNASARGKPDKRMQALLERAKAGGHEAAVHYIARHMGAE